MAINFDSGTYFSFDKAGIDIWNFIEKGATVEEIVQGIEGMYHGSHVDIDSGVNTFIKKLLEEKLIIPCKPKESSSKGINGFKIEKRLDKDKLRFETPVIQEYTDMQELLLLDPVHEVDETGWPGKKSSSSDTQ